MLLFSYGSYSSEISFCLSVAALESPEMMDPLVMPQYCFEDPRHEEADMLDEEQELRKHLRTKRKYGKRRGVGGGPLPPKMDHHSNGFINRNSVLLKDLHPQCPDKGGEGEPVVQVNLFIFIYYYYYYFFFFIHFFFIYLFLFIIFLFLFIFIHYLFIYIYISPMEI